MIPRSDAVETLDGPRVSVIVRTYRGRLGFLREAVDSVLQQRYRNVELVLVEDGSDEAAGFAESLQTDSDHRVVYRACPKGGRCRTGNAGLELASGHFGLFLDDDDLLFPDHISRVVTPLLRNPLWGAAYSLAYEVPTEIVSREPLQYREQSRYVVYRQPFSRGELARRNFMAIQSVLFRRELFKKHGGFREDLDCLEDWNLWQRYASDRDFALVDCVTSLYRVAGDAESSRQRVLILDDYRRQIETETAAEKPRSVMRRLRRTVYEHPLLYRLYWRGRQWYFRLRKTA